MCGVTGPVGIVDSVGERVGPGRRCKCFRGQESSTVYVKLYVKLSYIISRRFGKETKGSAELFKTLNLFWWLEQ